MSRARFGVIFAAVLQAVILPRGENPSPSIGNRANHFSYQPTPGEVDGRERAMGIRPTYTQQRETDRKLEQLDRDLLRAEGSSTKTVPDMPSR
jgi:hypothetical protein